MASFARGRCLQLFALSCFLFFARRLVEAFSHLGHDRHEMVPQRRQLLLAATLAPIAPVGTRATATEQSRPSPDTLLALLRRFVETDSLGSSGAPATPVALSPAAVEEVSMLAGKLETSFLSRRGLLKDPKLLRHLSGNWRLLYTDAPEITGLANLPLGLALGPVYQLIDVPSGDFENEALITHKLGLVKGDLAVVGTFTSAQIGSVNAAGKKNVDGNRIDVDFQRLVFSVIELGGFPTGSLLRKVASPTRAADAPQPAVDITFLDDNLRITRGGDGSLFVLEKEGDTGPASQLRNRLLQEQGEAVSQGAGAIRWISRLGV